MLTTSGSIYHLTVSVAQEFGRDFPGCLAQAGLSALLLERPCNVAVGFPEPGIPGKGQEETMKASGLAWEVTHHHFLDILFAASQPSPQRERNEF